MKAKLTVILGPTASGKTDYGIRLAREQNGAIVSADSRQVYAGMNIGTAKPKDAWADLAHEILIPDVVQTPSRSLPNQVEDKLLSGGESDPFPDKGRMGWVHHFLFNIRTPDDPMTLSEWQSAAFEAIDHVIEQGKHPILVGGTMLYIDSIVFNFEIPNVPPNLELRSRLGAPLSPWTSEARSGVQSRSKKHELSPLYQQLIRKDPAATKFIEPHNTRRIIRALEVIEATGKPFSELRKKRAPRYKCTLIGLFPDWEKLRKRIATRAKLMIEEGLLEEMKALRNQYGLDLPLLQTMNYKQAGMVLAGQLTEQEAIEEITRVNTKYARRQMSWWKNRKNIQWIGSKDSQRS